MTLWTSYVRVSLSISVSGRGSEELETNQSWVSAQIGGFTDLFSATPSDCADLKRNAYRPLTLSPLASRSGTHTGSPQLPRIRISGKQTPLSYVAGRPSGTTDCCIPHRTVGKPARDIERAVLYQKVDASTIVVEGSQQVSRKPSFPFPRHYIQW